MSELDAVVVGAGPNGLSAAVTLAQAGRSVVVLEAASTPGGGARSKALIESDVINDVCSAVHALGIASPFFRSQPLERLGLEWVHPPTPLAHPLDDGRCGVAEADLDATIAGLGADGKLYRSVVGRLARRYDDLCDDVLGPVVHVPRHPIFFTRFGLNAVQPAAMTLRRFSTDEGQALFAGCAAHAMLPFRRLLTSSFGMLLLAGAHAHGWPFARGGSQRIIDALVARLVELGGRVECGREVRSLADIPAARTTLFDTSPRQLAAIAGDALPKLYRRRLNAFRHGPGAFKIDYVLDAPVPWRAEAARRAGTVHVGGTGAEIASAEAMVAAGKHADKPFVLVAQPSVADDTRAPRGTHPLWVYAHVPNGSTLDQTDVIEAQIERFAPGFRDVVRARAVITAAQFEDYNANYIGGDIAGGAHAMSQLIARPFVSRHNYRTPNPSLFLCSASTAPGGGVHGMCGFNAARAALRTTLK
ncbi:MAG: NAD(P)/FAD-dependent oxidoreductase [Acidimicrobiales bacterium]